MDETRVDLREMSEDEMRKGQEMSRIVYGINTTFSGDPRLYELVGELFGDNVGEGFRMNPPLYGEAYDHVRIGKNVFINSNCLMMARGGIEIGDGAMIAANVQLISNNHDPYDLNVLFCKKVTIKEGAWIGVGSTVLPGVTVGKHAVVGAGSVVTKDVPDYAVAVGNPARTIKYLDKERFE